LACTATAVANGTEMCRAAGSSSAHTGRCGSAITSDLAGSGADSSEWADTYIATVSTGAGLASSGSRYEPTGTCTAGTTTTIVCMAAPSASGVATGALVFTATVIEPCTATIKAIGARFVPTGTLQRKQVVLVTQSSNRPTPVTITHWQLTLTGSSYRSWD
jgi:hypothetical protein